MNDNIGPPSPKRHASVVSDTSAECNDVARFVGASNLTLARRYSLLKSHFKPGIDYSFPKGASGRSFQFQWLQTFPWLAYSKEENGGYCIPCVLFTTPVYNRSELGVLVTHPLTQFHKALELLRKHSERKYHKEAVLRADDCMKVMTGEQQDIRSRRLLPGLLVIAAYWLRL